MEKGPLTGAPASLVMATVGDVVSRVHPGVAAGKAAMTIRPARSAPAS